LAATRGLAYFPAMATAADTDVSQLRFEAALQRLEEIVRALKLADVKSKLANVGADAVGTTPAELEKFVRAESSKFAQLIKLSGAKATD